MLPEEVHLNLAVRPRERAVIAVPNPSRRVGFGDFPEPSVTDILSAGSAGVCFHGLDSTGTPLFCQEKFPKFVTLFRRRGIKR